MLSFAALSETAIAESTTTLDASAFMSGAAATASAGAIGQSGETTLTGVSATEGINSLGVAAQTTLASAVAPAELGIPVFGISVKPSGVSATITAADSINDTTYLLDAAISIRGSDATTAAGTAGFDAKANITLDAATADADLTVNDFTDEDAQASTTLSGVSATGAANWDTVTALQVIFLNTEFERSKTVNVVPYGNYKVYITR